MLPTKCAPSNLELYSELMSEQGEILFMCEGRGDKPSELTIMHPYPPYNTTVLLDNYYGRQFSASPLTFSL